jgi:trk system potassium uptake protein TrkH
MGDMAKILYLIYSVLTAALIILLLLAGMSPYDALLHRMGTAGTGGFSHYAASAGHFNSALIDGVLTLFMLLFGTNFAVYYRMVSGSWREALKSEELHWYLGIVAAAVLLVSAFILPQYGNWLAALRYGSFQVASLISTTGYSTQNYMLWPLAGRAILLFTVFIGSCAGSTAGGLKVVRFALLCKMGRREIRHSFQPRKTQVIRFEGKGMDKSIPDQVLIFFFLYIAFLFGGVLLVSLENRFDLETNFTAALACVSNVGLGFGALGPAKHFGNYGPFAKAVLSLLMLAGRLELFPMLALFHPVAWKRQ